MNELLSVIIPVYNTEKYLDKCIYSVVNQTYNNLEIILIDDGSTDNSLNKCNEWKQKDERIVVIHKENGGLSSVRNEGLEIAKGKYITFVDSDDYIDINMYYSMMDEFKNDDVEIVTCGVNRIKNGRIRQLCLPGRKLKLTSKEAIAKMLCEDEIDVSCCNKIFEVKLFNNLHFPIGKNFEDMSVIPIIISKAKKIVCLPSAFYFYSYRNDSITNGIFTENNAEALMQIKDIAKNLYEEYPILKNKIKIFKGHFAIINLRIYWNSSYDNRIYYNVAYKQYMDILVKSSIAMIFSNYSSYRKKIEIILLLTGIYPLFLRLLKINKII